MNRPRIAVSLGDPGGIGPEVVAAALAAHQAGQIEYVDGVSPHLVVVGSGRILRRAAQVMNVRLLLADEQLVDVEVPGAENVQPGSITAAGGRAAYEYVRAAVELIRAGRADALVTAPVNKEGLRMAGLSYLGHTEILAALTNTVDPLTMFQVGNLRVFFLSRHVSLRQACELVKRERIVAYLVAIREQLGRLGLKDPTIAVAALNPHCGEGGLLGEEEAEHIAPAVRQAIELGIRACGPIAADAVFHMAKLGRYDCVLSMYHDQGHIATKPWTFLEL